MDISNLNCPQFVSFDSEAFQRDVLDSSALPTDLDTSNHSSSNVEEETLAMSNRQSMSADENEEYSNDYRVQSNMGPSIEEMSLDSCSNVEEETLAVSNRQSMSADENEEYSNDYIVQSNMGPSIEERSLDSCNTSVASEDFESTKENCIIHKNKTLPIPKAISAFRKPTIPQPFQFQTDNRVKNKAMDNCEYKEENFASTLRHNTVPQSKKTHVTKVQPFHLTEGKKRKRVEEFKSLAEQVAAFQGKTPERYHTSHKSFQPQTHWEPPPLTAKSPQLQALKRRRVISALSKNEQEEKEVQEMKSHQFHARPLDPKIYRQSVAQSKLARAKLQLRRKKSEKHREFKARPVPRNILNGPVGLKEKRVMPLTEAKAPAFEVENRIEKRRLLEERKSQMEFKKLHQKKIAKQPSVSKPTVPWMKKSTEIQPFSFDKMDKERFLQKEKKIQEEIENEKKAHVFHAQLLPSPMQSALPPVAKKPPTKPEPFNFALESRNARQINFTEEENKTFRAQPAIVLTKKPFVPEKLLKPEIQIQEFTLYTDRRASERQQLKEIKEAEEHEKEQALLLQKAKEEEKERMELMELRKEIVHKANPIRQYKPLEIKPSSLPLTQPESPEFETDKRLQAKH